MDQPTFESRFTAPTAEEFINLRDQIGWGEMDLTLAKASLDNSLFHVTMYKDNKLAAMGRVVGDGYMYFYIQDVVVSPEHQGTGLGNQIMQHIEEYLSKTVKVGATVGLLAAKGKEGFYRRYDYLERSGSPLGLGMCKFITHEMTPD